jgi:hypothetical protein
VQGNRKEKTMMHDNDEGTGGRIDASLVNEDGSSATRAASAVKLTRSAEPVLLAPSSCDLMEGGLGI